jgi:hypothetical protein
MVRRATARGKFGREDKSAQMSVNQDPAQVLVASLTDAKQLRLAAGRVLTWHDAEPRCELSAKLG